MNRKNYIKVKPVVYIPVIILILSLAIYFTINDSIRINKLHADFDRLQNHESVNGKVTEIYTEKGACFITLETDKKIFVPTSRNDNTKNVYLARSIKVGDSIYKNKESDTLYLDRRGMIEYFVIGN